jgi:hypothetical protein
MVSTIIWVMVFNASVKNISAISSRMIKSYFTRGPSWSWSYGSWIYNYLCNQCLPTLMLWVWITLMARCTRYNIIRDQVCQWLVDWYFRSLKRFWDCDFKFVNVLELHHSMENDKWYNKKSFHLAFHFSFNQNKLWTVI